MESTAKEGDRLKLADTMESPLPNLPKKDMGKETGGDIAQLMVEAGHLTKERLAYAKRVQSKLATPKTLLNVIQELNFVTADQIRSTLVANRVSVRLGALLVELGHIKEEDLQAAITLQQKAEVKKKLGEILVENHIISQVKLNEVLSYQLGFEIFEPTLAEIDLDLFGKSSFLWYAEHDFLPVKETDNGVIVAFADPLDPDARYAAEEVFGREIIPVISVKSALREIISSLGKGRRGSGSNEFDEETVVGLVNSILERALETKASDVHMEPMKDRLRIRFRIDGVMVPFKELSLDLAPTLSSRIKILAKADIAEKRRHQGGRILYEDSGGAPIDIRVSIYATVWGEKIVLRILNRKDQILDMSEIGMLPNVLERFKYDALDLSSGIIIVTGPTGSGKTTTLYSCVNYLNDINTSIITAEDPVEYVIDGISQCSIDPKIGVTYEETLRHIVRQDPDVIVIGEIRDRFSAETSIQAALTGHKVLTTFHTEDSIGGLLRLLNMDIEAFLISSTVVCVAAQRLLRKICPNCSEAYTPTAVDLRQLGYTMNDVKGYDFRSGRGCPNCHFTGYAGRLGVFELLVLDEKVKDAILSRKTSYEIRRISLESSGLVTLLEEGMVKAAMGATSIEEVLGRLPRLSKPRPIPELKRLLGVR